MVGKNSLEDKVALFIDFESDSRVKVWAKKAKGKLAKSTFFKINKENDNVEVNKVGKFEIDKDLDIILEDD